MTSRINYSSIPSQIEEKEEARPPYFALMTVTMIVTVAMPIKYSFLIVLGAVLYFYFAYQYVTTFVLEHGSVPLPWWSPLAFLFCCFGGYYIFFGFGGVL